jgi:hypothetical protein
LPLFLRKDLLQNLISGDTADDCLVTTLKRLNRHGCATPFTETFRCSPHPVVVCLTNPLARFSFLPEQDPRSGILLGLSAFAGINTDNLITTFNLTYPPFLPGPCIRGFNSEPKPYRVCLKNAGTRFGNVDQLADAVDFLKRNPGRAFVISLRDPKKETDQGSGVAVSIRFYEDSEARLAASVYVPEMDVVKQLVSYIIPTYTFIQQIVALFTGKHPGRFYVVSDEIYYFDDDVSRAILAKSLPRIKSLREFAYQEAKEFDIRYLDMVIQHLFDFIRRIRNGDLLVNNPFRSSGHLEVFYDYGEAFRYGEAVERRVSWDGEPEIKHPQLAYYYNF